jgi:hypothetical protein
MIETLPEKYRDALLLSEIQGLTQWETAERLSISHSAAKSRVQRGRDQLRELLLACCHVEFDRSGRVVEWKARRSACSCDTRESPQKSFASIRPRRRLSEWMHVGLRRPAYRSAARALPVRACCAA